MQKTLNKKFAIGLASIISFIALTVTSTASWVILHSEEVPSDLK